MCQAGRPHPGCRLAPSTRLFPKHRAAGSSGYLHPSLGMEAGCSLDCFSELFSFKENLEFPSMTC